MIYGIIEDFFVQFGLNSVKDLLGFVEFKVVGFFDNVNILRLNFLSDEDEIEE